MPRRSARAVFAVPMSNPRYSCIESQLTISPLNVSAILSARALLPEPVGPTITAKRGFIAKAIFAEHAVVESSQDSEAPRPIRSRGRRAGAGTRIDRAIPAPGVA